MRSISIILILAVAGSTVVAGGGASISGESDATFGGDFSLEKNLREQEWRGRHCAVTHTGQAVFRDSETWKSFWEQAIAPFNVDLPEMPAVDFTREMVVGVFLGEKNHALYEIGITGVRHTTDGTESGLLVDFRSKETFEGLFSEASPIQPFHLKTVRLVAGPVTFQTEQP